jgi:hypothetical protein
MSKYIISQIVRDNWKEIQELYEDGHTFTQIARHLNESLNLNLDSMSQESLRKIIGVSFKKTRESIEQVELLENLEFEDSGSPDAEIPSNYIHNSSYYYDDAKDLYIVYIKSKPYKFTGTIIRDMKSRYSNLDGSPESINQICRNFEIPRNIFTQLKSIMGWTHDSEPFTDEEITSRDEDEMVSDALQKRKFSFFQKFTRQEEKMIKDAANNWWAFKGMTLNPLVEKLQDTLAQPIIPKIKLSTGDPHAVVISPFDLHYGKYAWGGEVLEEYSRQIARDLLIEKTNDLLSDIVKYNVEKIIIPVGSDYFHIDTLSGTTTKGTPQDCDGTYVQIMVEGQKLMIEFVEMLRSVAEVEIILTAGNHDFKLSHVLLQHLGAYYRMCPDVNVIQCHKFRQYFIYGNTLMGFTHGDSTKLSDLPYKMAQEAPELWADAKYKAFFTGHLHHEMVKDFNGVKVFQMPSLSGSDRWHHNHGYEGSTRSLHAYVVHREKGIRSTLMANV